MNKMIKEKLALAFLVLAAFFVVSTPAWSQPNVILIFIDDMGYKNVGYAGSDLCETPNIDKLANEGMVFTHAYASAANSALSGACMFLGRYAFS